MGGAIVKTAVLSEIIKALSHRGIDPQVYFCRDVRPRASDGLGGKPGLPDKRCFDILI
jgi:hypothetical protein